jgi:hypothetical protein
MLKIGKLKQVLHEDESALIIQVAYIFNMKGKQRRDFYLAIAITITYKIIAIFRLYYY